MNEDAASKKRSRDLVFGISIIVLAVIVGLLANSVITGDEFPMSGNAPLEEAFANPAQ